MVKKQTFLVPADRCGVWWVSIFHLYKGSFRKTSYVGDFVKVSVKLTRPNNWLKKKKKLRGILIRLKKEDIRRDSSFVSFKQNNVVLLKKRMTPKGKVLIGPINKKIKRYKFIASFSGKI